MTANHEDHSQARPAEPIVTHERPLTPEEAAGLGLRPGPSFAEQINAAMAEDPDIIVCGAVPVQIAQEERDHVIRHHARRFVLSFVVFAVLAVTNVVLMLSGAHGALSVAVPVGIAVSVPAFLYHEAKLFRAGGRIGDAADVVRGLFGQKAKS